MQLLLFFLLGFLGWRLLHRQNGGNGEEEGEEWDRWDGAPDVSDEADVPRPFGCKTAWLTVRAASSRAAAEALGCSDWREANWETGLAAAERPGWVFFSPPLEGYVLAVGVWDLTEDLPALERLAQRFSELQYFVSHRVVGLYGWARCRGGRLTRAYAYAGETARILWDEGELTPEERRLGLDHLPGRTADWDQAVLPDEGDVLRVSACWGVDTTFQSGGQVRSTGLVCRLPRL